MDRVRVWVMDRVVMDRVRVWHDHPKNRKLQNLQGTNRSVIRRRGKTARKTVRGLGGTGRLKFGRMLACRTRTARNRRMKDARRSVTGPLSAASARYLRMGDSF